MLGYTSVKRYVTMKTKWSALEEDFFGGGVRKQLVFKESYIQKNSVGWTTKRLEKITHF